jgi:hypothetical protein
VPSNEVDFDTDGSPACADCNDRDARRYPGAQERCDGIDNDCNGQIDDNVTTPDTDMDTVHDECDNCPTVYNAAQDDFDADLVGDACDDCPLDYNTYQSDFDQDGEGDRCDLDDGLIYVFATGTTRRDWQAESGYTTWNSYRGSLSLLRDTGQYTQVPGSNPIAARDCGLMQSFVTDSFVPAPSEVAFSLATGVSAGVESSLGTDSSGSPRINANPCP